MDPHMESYMMNDIESSLGLHREHLVALALLAGCDYNVHGVSGIGCLNALRLIKNVPRQEVFDRLRDWGKQKMGSETQLDRSDYEVTNCLSRGKQEYHCSCCGHPGTKRLHNRFGCEHCRSNNGLDDSIDALGCSPKGKGFKCICQHCQKRILMKEDSKQKHWQLKICQKIAATENFPDEEIIQIFMNPEHDVLECDCSGEPSFTWSHPKLEALESFLEEQLHWEKTYIRQKVLPLLSLYCLREKAAARKSMASDFINPTINGLYTPYSIQRIKVSFSKPLYRLRWRQFTNLNHGDDWLELTCQSSYREKKRSDDLDALLCDFESEKLGSSFIFTTDEDMILVKEACPELVSEFEKEQEARKNLKRSNSHKKKMLNVPSKQQLTITSFFKQRKGLASNSANIINLNQSSLTLDCANINNEDNSWETHVSEDQIQGGSTTKYSTTEKQENVMSKHVEDKIPSIDIKHEDGDWDWDDKCENLLAKIEKNGHWNVGRIKHSNMSDVIYVEDVEAEEVLYPCKASKFGLNSPRSQTWKSLSCTSKELDKCMHNTVCTPPTACIGNRIQEGDNPKVPLEVSESTHRFNVCRALF